MTEQRRIFEARVRRFIQQSMEGLSPESFERLALDIAAWQRKSNPVVDRISPETVSHWQQIPSVPVSLYRWLNVSSLDDDDCVRFETSGTTSGQPGTHRLRNTRLYDFNALTWARSQIIGEFEEVISLVEHTPRSSLAHMLSLFPSLSSPPSAVSWWVEDGKLRLEALLEHLNTLSQPIFFGSTAFALAELLEAKAPALPPGSTVMVTGGFKGRKTSFDASTLYDEIANQLAPEHLLTEYGMCELSSQLWGRPGTPYEPPPWLRVLAVDPKTGEPLENGEAGQLRFYDLCNLDSSISIETLDHGIVHEGGHLTLLGRLPGAMVRGCSLQIEPSWGEQ
jgi:hypothetical protein